MIAAALVLLLLSAPLTTVGGDYAILCAVAALLALALVRHEAQRSPRMAAALFVAALWLTADAVTSAAGLTWASAWIVCAGVAAIMSLWLLKTLLLQALPSDQPVPGRYAYGLVPARGAYGALNCARPAALGLHGGRVVALDGWVWHVRGHKFAKSRAETLNLDGVRWINTDDCVNPEVNGRLDAIVGKRVVPLVADCSQLASASSLERVLLKRGIVWIGTILRRS